MYSVTININIHNWVNLNWFYSVLLFSFGFVLFCFFLSFGFGFFLLSSETQDHGLPISR